MNKNKGFTLIELMIYIAVFTIITTVITLFVFNFINAYTKIRITKEVSESSQIAMETMLLEIKHAKNIYNPTSYFDSHPGQLSLETEKDVPTGEEMSYVDFYLDSNNRLCVKREGQTAEPLTSENIEINNLVFSYLISNNVKSIRIELSAIYRNRTERITHQATTTIISTANLRND